MPRAAGDGSGGMTSDFSSFPFRLRGCRQSVMRLSAFSHIDAYNYDEGAYIEIRQCKYLNNIVEQDHRFIKNKVWPTLGFKSFRTAAATIAGIELMQMIRKVQMRKTNGRHQTPAQQFYSLAV